MINIAIVILGIAGVLSQFITRKSSESEKPRIWAGLQYGAMIGVISLGGYNQYTNSQVESSYRKATIEIGVLSKVSEHFVPVLKNSILLQNNMIAVKSYLSYEELKESNPDMAAHVDWHKDSSEAQHVELEAAKRAFAEIQNSAVNILQLNISYGGIVPSEAFEWAGATLEIKFSDVPDYFDPYTPVSAPPKSSVVDYAEKTGRVFGLVMGKMRSAAGLLAED